MAALSYNAALAYDSPYRYDDIGLVPEPKINAVIAASFGPTVNLAKPLYDPKQLYQQCIEDDFPMDQWFGKVNSFRNPLGRGPGEGMLLMSKQDLDVIQDYDTHILALADGDNLPLIFTNMVITDAKCATPGAELDKNAIYYVSIADERYQLARVPLTKQYNIVSDDCDTYKSGTGTWTWSEMVNDIWQIAKPGDDSLHLTYEPDGYPENFDFSNDYALDALCVVLDRLGLALRLNNGVYDVVTIGDDPVQNPDIYNNRRKWDDYAQFNTAPATVPDAVRVVFRRCDCTVCCIDIPRPTPYPTGERRRAGSKHLIFDDLVPREAVSGSCSGSETGSGSCTQLSGSGVADDCSDACNYDELLNRACERADVYYTLLTKGSDHFQRAFYGALTYPPNERTKAVEWHDRGRGMITTLYRGPGILPPFALWDEWYERRIMPQCIPSSLFPYEDAGSGSGSGLSGSGSACDNGDGISATICDANGDPIDVCIKIVNRANEVVGNVFLAAFDSSGNLIDGGSPSVG